VSGGEGDHVAAFGEEQDAREHNEGVRMLANESGECRLDLVGTAHLCETNPEAERPRGRLGLVRQVAHRALAECARMPQDRDAGHPRQRLLEQLELLGDQPRAEERVPGEIAAGSGEARHEAVADGITHGHRDDGGRGGRVPSSLGGWRCSGQNEIDLETDKLGRERDQLREFLARHPILDPNIPALDIPALAEALTEGVEQRLRLR
jgi:hypothetical protein